MNVLESKKVSFLELFFDLAYVLMVTQLAKSLHNDHRLIGWVRVTVLGFLVWWCWSMFTWAFNNFDSDNRLHRLSMLSATGFALFTAVGVSKSFEGVNDALLFSVPYLGLILTSMALMLINVKRSTEQLNAVLRFLPIMTLNPVLVIIGSFFNADIRLTFWICAAIVNLIAGIMTGSGNFKIYPDHFVERHSLFIIIALGELMVTVGTSLTSHELNNKVYMAAIFCYLLIASLWWAYFEWIPRAAEKKLSEISDDIGRSNLARDVYTFGHVPIVFGIVLLALAIEEVLLHPTEHLHGFGLVSLTLGLILFVGGILAINYRAAHYLLRVRTAGLLTLIFECIFISKLISSKNLILILALTLGFISFSEIWLNDRKEKITFMKLP